MTIVDIVARRVGSGIETFDAGAAGPGGSRGLASQIGAGTAAGPDPVGAETYVTSATLRCRLHRFNAVGIAVERSQVRRILLAGKMRWRRIRSRATSTDPESVPKRTRVVEFYTAPPSGSTAICADEPGLVIPRTLKAAVNLLVGRDWLTGPLGRKEHALQRSATGLNELSLTGFWGANDRRFRPASSHVQP